MERRGVFWTRKGLCGGGRSRYDLIWFSVPGTVLALLFDIHVSGQLLNDMQVYATAHSFFLFFFFGYLLD